MKIIAVLILAALTGCATTAQKDLKFEQDLKAVNRLESSLDGTKVKCGNSQRCAKMFALTKAYVRANSDMKVQTSDENSISTYNPITYGHIGLQAELVPDKGDTGVIKIDGSCKGMLVDPAMYQRDCSNRLATAFEGFLPYLADKVD